MTPIADSLRQFVKDNLLFGEEITFSDRESFLEQGLIDSTGVLELVAFLEAEYGVTVDDEELVPENLDSVDNVVRFVEEKLPGALPLPAP